MGDDQIRLLCEQHKKSHQIFKDGLSKIKETPDLASHPPRTEKHEIKKNIFQNIGGSRLLFNTQKTFTKNDALLESLENIATAFEASNISGNYVYPVELENYCIEKNYLSDLRKYCDQNFKKVDFHFRFKKCVFKEQVICDLKLLTDCSFSNCTFLEDFEVRNCEISTTNIIFSNCSFLEKVRLGRSAFNCKTILFENCTFHKALEITKNQFDQAIPNLISSTINSNFIFKDNEVKIKCVQQKREHFTAIEELLIKSKDYKTARLIHSKALALEFKEFFNISNKIPQKAPSKAISFNSENKIVIRIERILHFSLIWLKAIPSKLLYILGRIIRHPIHSIDAFIEIVFSFFYLILNNRGASSLLPLLWILIITFFFAYYYQSNIQTNPQTVDNLYGWKTDIPYWNEFKQALLYSSQNTLWPLRLFENGALFIPKTLCTKLVAVGHSVVSTILFYLLILGIKNTFKIREGN